MRPSRSLALLALAALLLVSGCSDAGEGEGGSSSSGPTTLAATDADVGFLQDMYAHHTQAVVLANTAAQHAADQRVRSLALDIAVSQAGEQGQLLALLRDRGHDLGDPGRDAMAWAGHPTPVEEMPGMIDPDELSAVQQLRGAELDERFLALMAAHHEGGVTMAGHALGEEDGAGAGAVVTDEAVLDLATQMRSTQQRELTDLALLAG